MRKLINWLMSVLMVPLLLGVAMVNTHAQPIKICGHAATGAWVSLILCQGVVWDKEDPSGWGVNCTTPAPVWQTTSTLTVNKGATIYMCYLAGGALCKNFTFTADKPGMYGVTGTVWGLTATWYDPKQYPGWVCK
jgi:hypothetical protein